MIPGSESARNHMDEQKHIGKDKTPRKSVSVFLRGQENNTMSAQTNPDKVSREDLDKALEKVVESGYEGVRTYFRGTRVPVDFLFAELRGGKTIATFLDGFDTVTAEQVDEVLRVTQKGFDRR